MTPLWGTSEDDLPAPIRLLELLRPYLGVVRRFFAEKMGPVMTPRLASSFAAGDYIALGAKTRPDAWSHWLSAHPSTPRPGEIRFHDHHFLSVEAASAGLGVALSPLVLAIDDVEKGRLMAPRGFDADGSHYGLIWAGTHELDPAASALAEWLQSECTRSSG